MISEEEVRKNYQNLVHDFGRYSPARWRWFIAVRNGISFSHKLKPTSTAGDSVWRAYVKELELHRRQQPCKRREAEERKAKWLKRMALLCHFFTCNISHKYESVEMV